jgi:peptide-methionine (S)-S-oxide reductase
MEKLFRKQPGVISIKAGYCGGENEDPTYENHAGHAEAIEVTYGLNKTTFKNLLDFFFRIHDPTTKDRQGNDTGDSYRSAIFYQSEKEKKEAEDFIKLVNKSKVWKNPVVTKLEKFNKFNDAEDYHQDYLQKNPGGYTCHFVRTESLLK